MAVTKQLRTSPIETDVKNATRTRTVAVAGLGAVGQAVARALDKGIPGLQLVAVSARNRARAQGIVSSFQTLVPVQELGRLAEKADIVVECLPSAAFPAVAEPTLRAGRTLVVISVGALLAYPHIPEMAAQYGGEIIVPTGALLGLDAVQAAAQGTINSIRMITRKPPAGLANAPYLRENGITLDGLSQPLKIFEGSARNAIKGFPANVNVAVALSLAGIGPDDTHIEIWADPTIDRNWHTIKIDSDSARFEMSINNIPTEENPATGKITALSVVAALKKMASPVRIGT
jgi:aspartate dehydrogenase